jgi:hypothetical protein
MRKVALFATVVCFIFCYSLNAVGQQVPRYVGPSTAYTEGAARGYTGMNQFCQTAYGLSAHMCNVAEFFSSAGTSGKGNQLWVQPALSNCVYDADPSVAAVMCQEAGSPTLVPTANLYITCGAWASSTLGAAGTSVLYDNINGWTLVTDTDCSTKVRVACCAP